MTWIVGPETLPDNLGGQLLAAGLEQGYDCRGMAMDLRRFSGVLSPPPDMTLGAVETDSDLEAWVRAYLGVFGFPVEIKGDCLNLVRGLGPSGPWRRFAAFADGGVAAVSSLFLGSQVAGIYDVATAPPFRRRGLGQAMTELALIEARRMGYTIAVLGSTDEGHRLYERMGFLDYCPLAFYVWTGQKPGEAA
jgi:ribosomal protein S18 acetylase RimI-like enzyme